MNNRSQETFRYLPIRPRDQQWGLYVTAAGFQAVLPGARYTPPGHPPTHAFDWMRGRVLDEYGIIYVVRDCGEFDSKSTGLIDVGAGNVILVFPGVWHRYRPGSETGWEVYWVHFQGENVRQLQQRGFIRCEEAVLTVGLDDAIIRPFVRLLDRLRMQSFGFQHMIAADTLEILAAVLAAAGNYGRDRQVDVLVQQAKVFLEEDVEGVPCMEDIATKLNLSRARFFRVFKEATGYSPYQYYMEARLARARHMLRDSSISIQQIARTLGFCSVFHFSKVFKNKVGLTPTSWRQRGFPGAD